MSLGQRGRALAGAHCVAGSASTCIKDDVIWVRDALLELIIHGFVIPNGEQGRGLGVELHHVLTMV